MRLSLLVFPLVLLGCGLAAPTTGEPLSSSAATATFEVRAAHTDAVKVQVVYPADADGHPAGANHPAVVFVQGGAVSVSRYLWLAQALAERGYVVALPDYPLALALFDAGRGNAARELLVSPPAGSVLSSMVAPTRIAIAGHSLGGVAAAKLVPGDLFAALMLQASFVDPADGDTVRFFRGPKLDLGAELDCSAKLADVRSGFPALGSPAALVVLQGATHYQFTDSQGEDDARGCAPAVSLEDTHQRIVAVTTTFLGAALSAEPGTGAAALEQLDGVKVEEQR